MRADDDPNQGGDGDPRSSPEDPDQNDCRRRVRDNLAKIGGACIADTYACQDCRIRTENDEVVATAVAACAPEEDQDPLLEGKQACAGVPLVIDPETMECENFTPLDPQNPQANFKTATNHPDEEPVCLAERADPPIPTAAPLAAGIFGRLTTCNVTGTAELDIDGPRHPPADGVVYFTGEPCPGGSCDVGMFFDLHVEGFDVDASPSVFGVELPELFEFAKAKFRDMRGWGASVPGGARLDSGSGEFGAGELLSTGHGVVTTVACGGALGCLDSEPLSRSEDTILGRSDGPLDITVGWAGDPPRCSLLGTVSTFGGGFGVDLHGDIVNQPPQANAGADHIQECTSSGGATLKLDGSLSSDPDADPDAKIKLFSWRRGGRAGEQVGLQSMVDVNLGLGETQNYVLTVVDGFGQASHDTVVVGVADSTAPTIDCSLPDPATITPLDGLDEDDPAKPPISFTATATDACDPTASATIISFDCFAFTRGGKKIDKKGECAVAIDGATISILNAGGVDTHIRWIVRGADDSQNAEHKACEVLVVKP